MLWSLCFLLIYKSHLQYIYNYYHVMTCSKWVLQMIFMLSKCLLSWKFLFEHTVDTLLHFALCGVWFQCLFMCVFWISEADNWPIKVLINSEIIIQYTLATKKN